MYIMFKTLFSHARRFSLEKFLKVNFQHQPHPSSKLRLFAYEVARASVHYQCI